MRVLLTGVSGFIGSYLARFLAEAEFDVTGVYRRSTPWLEKLANQRRLRLMRAELAEAGQLQGPFDAIVHAAATSPGPGIGNEQIARDNILPMLALLDAARKWNSQAFIFFSSLSLHGQVASAVVDETCPVINPDTYGMSKYLGELMLAENAQHVGGLALRLPGVLGPGAHRNWLSGVAAKLRAGETVGAFHLDAAFNNAAHVADISKLVAAALTRPWNGFDAVVVGARNTIRVREAIERLATGLGVEAKIAAVAGTKPSFTLSSQRAMDRWNYDPMDIGAMIDRYAAETLANR